MSQRPNEAVSDRIQFFVEKQNKEVDDRIDFLREKLEKWKICNEKKATPSLLEELFKVSEKLRDLLPELNDPSLFKIDRELYPNQDWSDNDESARMVDLKDNFKELHDKIDIETYFALGKMGLKMSCVIIVYLKVIKYMSIWDITIRWTLESLLDSQIPKTLFRGLKLMKIVLDAEHSEKYQTLKLCSLLSRFTKIPTINHKNESKKKIALFIAELATECYEKFKNGYKYTYQPGLSIKSAKKLIINHIHHIIYENELSDIVRDLLYEVFIFQEDQNTRKKYLKYILRAIVSSPCQGSLDSGFKTLINCILWNIIHVGSDRMDKEMRIIDKQSRYKIARYLDDDKVKLLYKEIDEEMSEDVEKHGLAYAREDVEKHGFASRREQMEISGIKYFHKEVKRIGFEIFFEEIKRHGIEDFCKEVNENYGFAVLCKEAGNKEFEDLCDEAFVCGYGHLFFKITKCFNLMPCHELWTSEGKEKNAEETDYIFEKFFFYDDVMKNLNLLKIFFTAYIMRDSLREGEFIGTNYSRGISEPSVLMEHLGFYLNNPELHVPWHIEKTLKMCPFMIFEFGKEDLVIDLIRILRGKEVPRMKEELSHKIEKMKAIKSLANALRQKSVADYPKR